MLHGIILFVSRLFQTYVKRSRRRGYYCYTNNPQYGFTLIEMLVVIAIIGILASMLAPSLVKALGVARTVACANSLRNINMCINGYAGDFNGVVAANGIKVPYGSTNGNNLKWFILLAQTGYIDASINPENFRYYHVGKISGDLLFCPQLGRNFYNTIADTNGLISTTYYSVPTGLTAIPSWDEENIINNGQARYSRLLYSPAKSVLLSEGNHKSSWKWYFAPVETASSPWMAPDNLHNDGVNVLFFDSHIERRPNLELTLGGSLGAHEVNGLYWRPFTK